MPCPAPAASMCCRSRAPAGWRNARLAPAAERSHRRAARTGPAAAARGTRRAQPTRRTRRVRAARSTRAAGTCPGRSRCDCRSALHKAGTGRCVQSRTHWHCPWPDARHPPFWHTHAHGGQWAAGHPWCRPPSQADAGCGRWLRRQRSCRRRPRRTGATRSCRCRCRSGRSRSPGRGAFATGTA